MTDPKIATVLKKLVFWPFGEFVVVSGGMRLIQGNIKNRFGV